MRSLPMQVMETCHSHLKCTKTYWKTTFNWFPVSMVMKRVFVLCFYSWQISHSYLLGTLIQFLHNQPNSQPNCFMFTREETVCSSKMLVPDHIGAITPKTINTKPSWILWTFLGCTLKKWTPQLCFMAKLHKIVKGTQCS